MTQSPYNQFATDYLNQVLSPIVLTNNQYIYPKCLPNLLNPYVNLSFLP